MAPSEWLSAGLDYLTRLQHPVSTPPNPDAFPDKQYYSTGLSDLITVVVAIAIMALLRDVLRIWVFEPFAHWKLTRDLHARKHAAKALANGAANGHANGHANGYANGHANGHTNGHSNGHSNGHTNGHSNGYANGHTNGSLPIKLTKKDRALVHRSVLRFAEQGWSVVYSTFSWNYGYVRPLTT